MKMEYVAVLSPLFGALIAGLFGKIIGDKGAKAVTCGLMLAAAYASIRLFLDVTGDAHVHVVELFTWISSGDLNVGWSLRFDQLSVVMLIVVNVVSCLVHIYSVGYMSHDKAQARFMSYLSLFTFMMLMLVTSDNLLQMFFGWEGVGLASYLLIGFWHHKPSANNAAMKAFVTNRIGDFGMILGVFAVFALFGTLSFEDIFASASSMDGETLSFLGFRVHAISLICGLLFIGAMGKSAQLGLHVWLPDAMEGPTPVSALIHAATMVTAGVFMVARMSPLFELAPGVQAFITVIGALTALVAATIALTQFDIKRVIAYSTMSQLGYMFFALGVSAYSAAMFHLFTHAFFKALLFLGAGSVIHAMSDEQDMRQMGGLWKLIPTTYTMMWIGNLALAGVPFFAGYYSKDVILEAAFAAHTPWAAFAFWCGCLAAFMTAFYSWRLLFMTFHGPAKAREDVMARVHESPLVMLVPLAVLAVGAVILGRVGAPLFVGEAREMFWGETLHVLSENDSVEAAHHVGTWVKLLPAVLGGIGIFFAYICYMRARHTPALLAGRLSMLHSLFSNKWYFDEIYQYIVVRPTKALGHFLWRVGDTLIIDGFGPNAVASGVKRLARKARQMQTGYVYHYAFVTLIGVVVVISIFVLGSIG